MKHLAAVRYVGVSRLAFLHHMSRYGYHTSVKHAHPVEIFLYHGKTTGGHRCLNYVYVTRVILTLAAAVRQCKKIM